MITVEGLGSCKRGLHPVQVTHAHTIFFCRACGLVNCYFRILVLFGSHAVMSLSPGFGLNKVLIFDKLLNFICGSYNFFNFFINSKFLFFFLSLNLCRNILNSEMK